MKLYFPAKWILSLNAISSEVALSYEVAYVFLVKWLLSCEVSSQKIYIHKIIGTGSTIYWIYSIIISNTGIISFIITCEAGSFTNYYTEILA